MTIISHNVLYLFVDDNLGYTLLNYPSAPLQKLLKVSISGAQLPETQAIRKMCNNVLAFVTERHDLNGLKLFLFQAIRKNTCRSYGMQVHMRLPHFTQFLIN